MNNAALGLTWAFSFVILEAAQAVFFGGVFQDYDSFLIGAIVFGSTAIGALVWTRFRSPDQLRIAWNNGPALLGLNLSNAVVWVAYFFALQMIEPAVVFTIFSGLIPVAILIFAGLGIREASPLRNRIEGAGLLIVVTAIVYFGLITLIGQSGFVRGGRLVAVGGLLLTCLSAISLAAMMIYSQRLYRLGVAPVAQYGLRFLLYVIAAIAAAWLGFDKKGAGRSRQLVARRADWLHHHGISSLRNAEGHLIDVHPDPCRNHCARSAVCLSVPDRGRSRGLCPRNDDRPRDLLWRCVPRRPWWGSARHRRERASMTGNIPSYRTGLAVGAIVISVLALSLGDAIIKATGLDLPLWQMYILRSVLVLPPLWWLTQRRGRPGFGSAGWIILRSTLLVAMWLAYYSALPLMPLSLAAAAYYTSPILITVIASFVTRRWPGPRVLLAIFLGFAGVILILRPDASGFELATLLPLLAAFLYACAMVLTARKCRDDDPFALALALNVAFIAAGAGLGLFSGQEGSFIFGPWQALDLRLIGVVAALAAVILVGSVGAAIAYQNGPPATVAAFDYSYLVFSLIWGLIFFGELPVVPSLVGIVIIVAAGFLSLPRSGKPIS